MAGLTSKDAILEKVRDSINTDNEERCCQITSYIHSFLKDLHVKNGFVCIDDLMAITLLIIVNFNFIIILIIFI